MMIMPQMLRRNLIEHYFDNFKVDSIEIIGSGYDRCGIFVNNEYILKQNLVLIRKRLCKRKTEYFLNTNLETNVKIPNIEYSYIDELSILGYKEIKELFNTRNLFYYVREDKIC